MSELPSVIGLIAGNRQFPLLFAKAARLKGIKVVAAASIGDTSPLIHFFADEVRWFSLNGISGIFEYFRSRGVRQIIMAGQIDPNKLFREDLLADPELKAVFAALKDRQCDTIFGALADWLKKENLELLDSTLLLKDHLATKGTLTRCAPTEAELEDIAFGIKAAKHVGAMDIGQTVVVKNKAIIAVEGLEGTDRCIARGGQIARSGAIVVKVAKPAQDDRFDVPVVGPNTILTMKKCHACLLAIEAGKTLVLDRERTVTLANKNNICIVGF